MRPHSASSDLPSAWSRSQNGGCAMPGLQRPEAPLDHAATGRPSLRHRNATTCVAAAIHATTALDGHQRDDVSAPGRRRSPSGLAAQARDRHLPRASRSEPRQKPASSRPLGGSQIPTEFAGIVLPPRRDTTLSFQPDDQRISASGDACQPRCLRSSLLERSYKRPVPSVLPDSTHSASSRLAIEDCGSSNSGKGTYTNRADANARACIAGSVRRAAASATSGSNTKAVPRLSQ